MLLALLFDDGLTGLLYSVPKDYKAFLSDTPDNGSL
ncbi:DNA binding protein, partial [Yersinia pestis PY-03]